MAKTYPKDEVGRFISQLDKKAQQLLKLADVAEADARQSSYQSYMTFRDKAGEFETFAIIIENRLKALEGGPDGELEDKFDRITVLILTGLIRASIKFFLAMSEPAVLPLGTKEVFIGELRSLHNSREKLMGDKFQSKLSPSDIDNLKRAEQILMMVIERAPSLLSLDEDEED
ncbi:MAG: hypothetical protein FJX35_23070 [Alphaproteobacteria bacterium]|nr:hypothetical protein [Alphaproteobacteria bacterium]